MLGVTEADYFDAGLLKSKGMIRAPLREVRERLYRTGATHPSALPGAVSAVVPEGKLSGYSLNPTHLSGGEKARVFAAALGYSAQNAADLQAQLLRNVKFEQAFYRSTDQYGQRFYADVRVTGPKGNATVRTGWLVPDKGGPPRLTTAWVKPRAKKK